MHTTFPHKLYGFLIIAVFAILPTTPLFAQSGISIQVQPSTIEEQLDPGAVVTGVLTVTNENGGTQTYFLGTQNIDNMNESGRPIFSKDTPDDPMRAAAWIVPGVDSITLEQGKVAKVPYTISVPANASPGTYAAAIFVTREAEVAQGSGAGIGFNVGSLVNLRVSGEVIDDMKVLEFSTDKMFYTEPGVAFRVRVENTGTIFQRPSGIISITDMLGNSVETVVINTQGGGVLPQTTRTYEESWTTDTFTLGKYTAVASVVYGDGVSNTKTVTRTFWIVPVKEVGMVVGGLLLLILVFVFGIRAYVRKQLRNAGHATPKKASTEMTLAQRMTRTLVRVAILLVVLFVGYVLLSTT